MSARAQRLVKDFPEVPPEHILIGTRKDMVNLDILLDDGAHNITRTPATYPVLFRKPWNTHLSGLLSVNSYEDFLHLVEMIRHSFVAEKPNLENGGVVCLVGPTGSGKTTTLYAALSEINKPDINIITVEDPVEMIMDNMTQVEVNAKTGLTFAAVMRAILRQDPDVVMVGEIRDEETAKIAMTLSITGHLVFSTLHTFDSPSAIMRLVDMGVEPYMVYSALSAVISQRLVRTLCPHCTRRYKATLSDKQYLGISPDEEIELSNGQGCDECNGTGYKGRTAVHEILLMSPAIRDDLAGGGNTESVRRIAKQEGMKTLLDNLRELVLNGTTTISELRRTYSEYV
jgi:type IV pilus assembly protein PilB